MNLRAEEADQYATDLLKTQVDHKKFLETKLMEAQSELYSACQELNFRVGDIIQFDTFEYIVITDINDTQVTCIEFNNGSVLADIIYTKSTIADRMSNYIENYTAFAKIFNIIIEASKGNDMTYEL